MTFGTEKLLLFASVNSIIGLAEKVKKQEEGINL
jgi:hypothetical protein